jgi:serine/threonine-protein kinase
MTDPEDDSTKRARERIGKVLRDKWRIDGLLGIGGMAAVYAATHTNNGKQVAIKLLHPEVVTNPEARSRFLREGYVANKVGHPGTVQVLDDDVDDDGSVFLVMELLDGESFEARRVRSGNFLPPIDVLKVADRVLDVLAMAHEKGIVHRDIKPDNIFLTRDGGVKLLDFGIARLRDSMRRATMTSGGAIGTPAFMPPEQARGRWNDVGPRTDLWALGATMFTALTGHLVHEAETVNELLLAAMTKPAPPLATFLPGVPVMVSAVVDRALAHEMDARWPDARTMQSMVRMAFQSLAAAPPAAGSNGRWGGTVRMPQGNAAPELPSQPVPPAPGRPPGMGGMMAGPLIAPPPGSVPQGAPAQFALGGALGLGQIADPVSSLGRPPSAMSDPGSTGARQAMMIADPGSTGARPAMAISDPGSTGARQAMIIADPITGSGRPSYPMIDPMTGAARAPGMIADSLGGTGPHAAVRANPNLHAPPPQFASGGFSSAMTSPMPQKLIDSHAATIGRAIAPRPTKSYGALVVVALGLLLLVIGLALVFVLRGSPAPAAPAPQGSSDAPALSASAIASAANAAPVESAAPSPSAAAPPPPSSAPAEASAKPHKTTVKKR